MTLQMYHGDCLEVMKDLSANSVSLFICDLPYNCFKSTCNWDSKEIDLDAFWKQIERLAKDDHTPVLMFASMRFAFQLIKSKQKWFRFEIIWEKPNAVGFLQSSKQPLKAHELILVFSKSSSYYKRIDITGDFKFNGGGRSKDNLYGGNYEFQQADNTGKRCVRSVVKIGQAKTKDGHPTQKPDELYKWLIERFYPNNDGVILDPTAGSFSSCFMAQEMKISSIGIEKDDEFFKKAKERAEGLPVQKNIITK